MSVIIFNTAPSSEAVAPTRLVPCLAVIPNDWIPHSPRYNRGDIVQQLAAFLLATNIHESSGNRFQSEMCIMLLQFIFSRHSS
jgi:hypothetical protein